MQKVTEYSKENLRLARTRSAFLWTCILRAPFWAIYNLLLFILYKDLKASAFQIALFIGLRPVVSILSVYWSSFISKRLLSNIVWAGILGYLPFLFLPFFYSSWMVIFASAVFMMMHRGVVPAWMEIFKRNLPGDTKQKIFSYGSIVSYVAGALLPLFIGPLLDRFHLCWRYVFAFTALMGICAAYLQRKIPLEVAQNKDESSSCFEKIMLPWKSTWQILSQKTDFRAYQIGFMIFGGAGLMLMQPALPRFFIDVLGLSYTELSFALSFCKGVGFALTSQIWARAMHRIDFFRFSSLVTAIGVLFPLILLASQLQSFWVFGAYFIYGILQAGSELSWHLSGPHFAREEDSSAYSNVNILTVGLRGLVIPQLGTLLCIFISSTSLLMFGAICCLLGTFWMLAFKNKALYPSSKIKT